MGSLSPKDKDRLLMAEVLTWHSASDSRGAIQRTIGALAQGKLVALPTETVYGLAASGLHLDAVRRLVREKGREQTKPLTLAVASPASALDFAPRMSPLGRRLARRCWPGPVTLVFSDGVEEGVFGRLPEEVRQRVGPSGTVGLRVPDHPATREVLLAFPGPLVLTSANRSGDAPAVTAGEVLQSLGEQVDLVVDGGPCRFGQASTVVQVNGGAWRVLREGVVPAAALERVSACLIVFVCTGNTCRSPMAEALCKKLLADRLGCLVEELPQRGFIVQSAGVSAMMGDGAAPEAIEVLREMGAEPDSHCSRPLTPEVVAQADYLLAMTRGHLAAILTRFGNRGCRPRLLCPDGNDLADPIGGDVVVYRECAQQIREYLQGFLAELPQP